MAPEVPWVKVGRFAAARRLDVHLGRLLSDTLGDKTGGYLSPARQAWTSPPLLPLCAPALCSRLEHGRVTRLVHD